MFDFLKRKIAEPTAPVGSSAVTLNISDMHCASCALSIDETLEELPGVHKSSTNYARAQTKVVFDEAKTTVTEMQQAIAGLGYTATV